MVERIPGYCPLCISRCGTVSVIKDGVFTSLEPLPGHPTGKAICMKGKAAPELVYSRERLLKPLKRTNPKDHADPGWQEISWEEAFDTIVEKLQEAALEAGPESVCFAVTTPSGTSISDSFIWINRLARAFGSPNTLFATENCNWHKDFAPKYTFGNSIGMPDYEKSGCILLWGFNPVSTWPAQVDVINQALKRGARLIVVDPRRAGLAARADEWLPVRPAADGPLAMALANELITKGCFDEEFIRRWSNAPLLVRQDTNRLLTKADLDSTIPSGQGGKDKPLWLAWDEAGQKTVAYDPQQGTYEVGYGRLALFGEFDIEASAGKVSCKTVFQLYADMCSHYTPKRAEEVTGIPARQIIRTARLLHASGPVSYFTWTGTAQQARATQTGRAISLLYALTGHLDAPGGNVYFSKAPVVNMLGMELLSASQRSKTLGLQERPLGPGTMGWITSCDLYKSVTKGEPYRTRALISFGGNPLLTKPNAPAAVKALEQLEFYAHADMFLNPTANYADIILPVASPWERSGFYPGFQISREAESLVQLRPAVISPLGECRSDNEIVFELAKRLRLGKYFFEGDFNTALKAMIEPAGLTIADLKSHPQGINLKLDTAYRKYEKQGFATPSKKVEIFSETFQKSGYSPIPKFDEPEPAGPDYPLWLICAKWVTYCHSQQRHLPSLKKRMPVPLVEINPETAKARSIKENDLVKINTPEGFIQARARFNKHLAEDVVCSQYGWWQNSGGSYNDMISDEDFDPISSSNRFRNVRCNISGPFNL